MRSRSHGPVLAALVAFGVTLGASVLTARPAAAYERQWHVGGTFGYSALLGATRPHGFGGGLHVAYGINDTFNLVAELNTTAYPLGRLNVLQGAVGAHYIIDVLRWVPYFGLLAGAADFMSLDAGCVVCHKPKLTFEIPFGIDYQVTRAFTVGVAGRFNLYLVGDVKMQMGAFAKAEYVWGY